MTDDQKIDSALRTKWLQALRAMCCLGVLCDVSDPHGWAQSSIGWEYEGRDSYPPFGLLKKVGIASQGALANRNDGRSEFKPHSFAEIADFIESGGADKYV